ncbi:LuxR C-terminal-related transcriptional regulator [Paenibacillus sp. JCM 10914]
MDESVNSKLTLISAPAGFGKTTLASHWIHLRHVRAAWVSLDEGDNQFLRFWGYLIESVGRCHSSFDQVTSRELLASPGTSMETLMSFILNELSQISTPVVIVLDDYHVITDAAVHDSLAFLLQHLPSMSRLMILSRTLPPLPLSRWRVRKQLLQIEASELRFTMDEIEALQEKSSEQTLLTEDLILLEQKTEGWVAGLILAFLSIDDREDVSSFLSTFSGSHHFVFDYLMEEVLLRQSEELQSFLLQTSILDRMNAPLAEAVSGHLNASEMFHILEKSHMFLIPLDDTRTWFRYHHLFSDMLNNRLTTKSSADAREELHRRAYVWYEENGLIIEAIEHMMQAGDHDKAAECMEQHLSEIMKNGHESALKNWLQKLPLQRLICQPDLFYYRAGSMALSGHVEETQNLLERTLELVNHDESLFPAEKRNELEMRVGLYRASIAFYQGDIDTFIELLDTHREGLQRFATIVKVVNLGEALLHRGPIGFGGRLKKMAYLASKVSESPERRAAVQYALQGHGFVFLADLHYESNRVNEARAILEEAIGVQGASQNLGVLTPGVILLSKIQQAQGDWEAAVTTLEQAIKYTQSVNSPHWQQLLEARLIRLQLLQGTTAGALIWAERRHLHVTDRTSISREYENLTLVRLLMSVNETEDALSLLKNLETDAWQADRLGSQIEIQLLLALACHDLKRPVQAVQSLEKALFLAESEGYVRIFLDEGSRLFELLTSYVTQCSDPVPNEASFAYAKVLLALYEGTGIHAPIDKDSRETSNVTLTNREQQILQLIAAGRSNEDIAKQLFLSQGTIKRYTHNLYQKLEVKSRVQAVARAQELNLL